MSYGAMTDSLIVYYKFDNNTYDSGPKQLNLTNRGASYNSTCKINGCYLFNPVNEATMDNFMNVTGKGLTFRNQSNYTFSMWIRSNKEGWVYGTANQGMWAAISSDFNGGQLSGLFISTTKNYNDSYVFVAKSLTTYNEKQNKWFMNYYMDETWHHYAVTFNRTEFRVYRDGYLNYTDTDTAPIFMNDQDYLTIGGHINDGSFGYGIRAYIDEFGLWNRTLSSADILFLYNSGSAISYPFFITPVLTYFDLLPSNDSNINTNTLFNYNISSFGGSNANCTVYVNNLFKYSEIIANGAHDFTYDLDWGAEGYNKVTLNCTDIDSGYTVQQDKYVFVDTVNPIYIYVNKYNYTSNVSTALNNTNLHSDLHINISMSDSNMIYSFNISICNASITKNIIPTECYITDYVQGIDTQNYTYFNITSRLLYGYNRTIAVGMQLCDGHTNKSISELMTRDISNGKEIGKTKYRILTEDYLAFTTTRSIDRLKFSIEFNTPKKEIIIIMEDEAGITYLEDSPYQGHFIHGNRWTDFENKQIKVKDIYRFNETSYMIKLISEKGMTKFDFDSTGYINCIKRTEIFYVPIYIKPLFTDIEVTDIGIEWITFNHTPGNDVVIEYSADNADYQNITYINNENGTGYLSNLQKHTKYYFKSYNSTTTPKYFTVTTKDTTESALFYFYLLLLAIALIILRIAYNYNEPVMAISAGLIFTIISIGLMKYNLANIQSQFLNISIITIMIGLAIYLIMIPTFYVFRGETDD
jgi:hypothetical protein